MFRNDVNVPIFENTSAYRNREIGIATYSKNNHCLMRMIPRDY